MKAARKEDNSEIEGEPRALKSLKKRPHLYVAGIALVLAINVLTALVESQFASDCLILASILLIGFVFSRLFGVFACSAKVKVTMIFAVCALGCAQTLGITEEVPALVEIPILGNASAWNSFFTTLGMVTGLVLTLCALVLAIVDLGGARDSLSREMAVRLKAERALADHRDRLEEEVRARTLALEEAQSELLTKERLAALGEIMSTVSHELRNPLGTVRASLFTIQRGLEKGDTSRLATALERCDRSITRCDHIIEELQEFSHVQEVARRMTSLDEWLADLVSRTAIPESIRCDTDFRSNATLPMDQDRMGRALLHLITNSVNAFEDQVGREHHLIVSSLKNSRTCSIQIQDTGGGMTPEVMALVGEPLFSTRPFGAGLGVPIAEETVRRHGGSVRYESEVDKGTTVTIELPLQLQA